MGTREPMATDQFIILSLPLSDTHNIVLVKLDGAEGISKDHIGRSCDALTGDREKLTEVLNQEMAPSA
jgi:hypothetical protein